MVRQNKEMADFESVAHTTVRKTKKKKNAEGEKKVATFALDAALHLQLKMYAAQKNKAMVEIVERAVRAYMNTRPIKGAGNSADEDE